MSEPTALEKGLSSFAVKGMANSVAVFGATITPLAAFIPFLIESLASSRQSKRLESMFQELQALSVENAEKIKNLTDDQYKVVNEAISAAFYTINQEKISLLKKVVVNVLRHGDVVDHVSDALARAVRDISAAEAAFMVRNFGYELIIVSETYSESQNAKTLKVKPGSDEEVIMSGLINLGLLYSKTPLIGTVGFEWSPLVAKLLVLLDDA